MSAGVAFVLNKELISINKLETHELIKGRAITLTINWKEQTTTLINVYAPNRRQDHQDFWEEIEKEDREQTHACLTLYLGTSM
jgi:exonuclease III